MIIDISGKAIKDLEEEIRATDTCIMDLNEIVDSDICPGFDPDCYGAVTRLTESWHIVKTRLAMLLKET